LVPEESITGMWVNRGRRVAVLAAACVVLVSAAARSQSTVQDISKVSKLTIEQLLEVELTSTASKFQQEVTRAPASVTVVTGEDIRRHGYRTLAEVLNSVRGFYTTYDRNYSYVGVRGFARPGDYNTRVLLLIDGHRLNEPTYDMAAIGTDFPFDVSLIDRVEAIRGPGSSLYGASAFFGVINVITKTGSSHAGARVDAAAGSLSTTNITTSYGRVFDGGNELLVAASGYRSSGNSRLYYPEFDAPGVGDGLATNLDNDESASLFTAASIGRFQIRGTLLDRTKRIPTASFGTIFGDSRSRTEDRHGFADAAYTGTFGRTWTGVARAGVDYYKYNGTYPFDDGAGSSTIEYDGAESVVASSELTLNRCFASHVLTVGGEVRRAIRERQLAYYDDAAPVLDERHPATVLGTYVQDEITLRRWLLFNAGVRLDHHASFGANAAPRVGLVFLPRRQSSVKLLYGRAYRAPNSYELHYYTTMRGDSMTLAPETIGTAEVVWEEYLGPHVRTGVSLFRYDAEQLIEQRSLGGNSAAVGEDDLYFANAGRTKAHGVEGEVEGRWTNGVSARASYAYSRATDPVSGGSLSNSPSHLSKADLTLPIAPLASVLAVDVRAVGARRTLSGSVVEPFVLTNLVGSTTVNKKLELGLGLYNLFDRRYSDPGAEEHLQPAIGQDGRTFRVRLTARF